MILEISLSGVLDFVARFVVWFVGTIFLSLICLFPINDALVSRTQTIVFLVLDFVLFLIVFGFIKLHFTA